MFDTYKIYQELKDKLEPDAASALTNILGNMFSDLHNTVTKTEFNDLRTVVHELTEAQKRTEKRVDTLAIRMEELAEAQKRTEKKVEELAEAQKRTEKRVDTLAIRMEELAEAQKRTEKHVDTLAIRMEELAEAQKRTENSLNKLIGDHKETRRQLGGLSMTVGYRLEDIAYPALPRLLARDFQLTVKEALRRDYVQSNKGGFIEINILGAAERDGKNLQVIGESKSQLSKKDIDTFIRKKLKLLEGMYENPFPVLITYMTTAPDVAAYAQKKGIALYLSYQFQPSPFMA